MVGDNTVAILLACYNGGRYLEKQIESLRSQTYACWDLWIRDDCSTDDTPAILQRYAACDARIKLVDSGDERLGAARNFACLMRSIRQVGYSYVMFCDQDDIWYPEKVEHSLRTIKLADRSERPVLAISGYQYIDESDHFIRNGVYVIGMLRAHTLRKTLLNDNPILGCTMTINALLLEAAYDMPMEVENHDYWVALTAAFRGVIVFEPDVLMGYRQHASNVTGGLSYSSWANRLKRLSDPSAYSMQIRKRLTQTEAFYRMNLAALREEYKDFLASYLVMMRRGGLRAVVFMMLRRIGMRGFPQTVILYSVVVRDKIAAVRANLALVHRQA